ncbi:uncharacterized protein E6C27_scaffold829G00110 [Cucumis melo var. makuwa]|uniref:Uncharacterized protein n=1 Tax=Cucumis melo var. makuwa TaxID=1194695 RepID=A0A5A7TVW7_CUCMM|nr:uncharacterized protein E6C27_scaffold829G00110 [Cucumis melo var. makuwa]
MCLCPFRNYKLHQIPHLCRVHHPSVRVHPRVPPCQKCVPDPSHFVRPSDSLPASIFDSLPTSLSPSLSPSSQSTFCYILVLLLRAFISPACDVSHSNLKSSSSSSVQRIQLALLTS